MEAIEFRKEAGRYIISIDENQFQKAELEKVLNRIWIQYLVEKANADASILDVAQEIKADWWKKNGEKILSKIQ